MKRRLHQGYLRTDPGMFRDEVNFGTRQNLSRYLRLPTPKIRVYMLFWAYNDATLRLFMYTDSGLFPDEVAMRPLRPTPTPAESQSPNESTTVE
mgnify:CR=1 FL=1